MNVPRLLNGAALLLGLLGVYFKMHWWYGANALMLAGFGALLASVLGFTARANAEAGTSDALNYVMVATLTVGILGVVFRVMHWPGDALLVVASDVLLLALAVLLIFSRNRVVSHQFVTVLAVFFSLVIALLTFTSGHHTAPKPRPEPVALEENWPEFD
ncbi:hypothetical protein [Hymenobacter properus]|uniref:Uncharacterized protein n=1 Tax=Hymenobacter properus TaxID=2791026 RepID=A0A931FKM6_9BACT|nr:hypothetical protein [Hymenobacter properus]MBF9141870.1 hypothetical protein [Hymenobacter properus]MBR7720678.1 hypothetical protein [Microvirga sp. SRT04]